MVAIIKLGYELAVSGAKFIFNADVALLKIILVRSVLTDSTGTARVQFTAVALGAAHVGTRDVVALINSSKLVTSYNFLL